MNPEPVFNNPKLVKSVLIILVTISIIWLWNLPPKSKQEKAVQTSIQSKCIENAFYSYIQSGLAISKQKGDAIEASAPIVQFVIEKRRLEEAYCVERAKCLISNNNPKITEMEFSNNFSSCIMDEGKEDGKE